MKQSNLLENIVNFSNRDQDQKKKRIKNKILLIA